MRSLVVLTLFPLLLGLVSATGYAPPPSQAPYPGLSVSYHPQYTILQLLQQPSLIYDSSNLTHIFNATAYHIQNHLPAITKMLQQSGHPHTLWLPDDRALAEAAPRWQQYMCQYYNMTAGQFNRTWETNATLRSHVMAWAHAGIMWSVTKGNISLYDLSRENLLRTMLNDTRFVLLGMNQTTKHTVPQKMRIIRGDQVSVFGKNVPMDHSNRTNVMVVSGSGQYLWQYGHVYRQIIASNGIIYVVDRAVDIPMNATRTLKNENSTLFLRGIHKSGLNHTINNTPNITLFVPTDEAIEHWIRDYKAANPSGKKWTLEQLKAIIAPYIVNGTYYAQDLNTTAPPTLRSLHGGHTHPVSRSPDGHIMLHHNVTVVAANVLTRNGVIHFINDTFRDVEASILKSFPRSQGFFNRFL